MSDTTELQMKKSLKIPAELHRAASVEFAPNAGGGQSPQKISISTDEPYLRYDWYDDEEYWEVLSHDPGDIDDSRLKAGLPGLYNHDRDIHLSRATGFENTGHKLYVTGIKWSESDIAQEKKKDQENGVLPDTSVGYQILGEGVCIGAKDDKPIYKFRWQPFEFSLVTVPADITCGAGRQRAKTEGIKFIEVPITMKESIDEPAVTNDTRTQATMKTLPGVRSHFHAADQGGATGGEGGGTAAVVDEKAIRAAGRADYKARCKRITDHVESDSMKKFPEWQKAARVIAAKMMEDDEPDFQKCLTEINQAFKTEPQAVETDHSIEVIGERAQDPRIKGRRALSVGAQFVRSKDFLERGPQTGRRRSISVETDMSMLGIRGKVQMATRAGFNSSDLAAINVAPQQQMIALGMERLTIMDLIAPGTTSAAAIPYPKETSQGTLDGVAVTAGMPRAGNVGERGVKPIWEPDITTDTANVKKIAVVTKVPDEFLADFPAFQSYIDARLPAMVDMQAENQILYGDGTGNNIKGILTNAGILTRAYASNWFTTIKKAITDVEVGSFFTVDAIAMHPYDWEVASLELDANNQPYAGGPFYIPYGNGVYMELRTFWGKPVVSTVAVTVGQPVIGCWKLGAQYFMREGMRIETTNANEDDFKRNLIALRAEERLALATYRPACFLEVTGGPART